eukprot:9407096-Pyramimonas_sp.AAC.1
MALMSPQLMKQHLRGAVFRTLEWEAGATWDVPHRLCFDVVKAELRRKRYSSLEKGCVRAVATDAVWIGSKARRLGYQIDPTCPLCGAVADTLRHRLWACGCQEVVEIRE